MQQTWKDAAKVAEYVGRVGRLAPRQAGEAELVEYLPVEVGRALDLGCGDGRLTDLVLAARPFATVLGLDSSPPMLALARKRFATDERVTIEERDLRDALPAHGRYDLVVSGFAIHHLTHERKRALFAEIASLLESGGVFCNLEVVQCATPARHAEFNSRIERPGGDPEDILAPVDDQLAWMREAGLGEVDCAWRWRGFALLVAQAP